MNKSFFLAALTAVALSLGFTACNDDDDVAGKYEMNVFLRLAHISSDQAESQQIIETYINALSITNKEDMVATIQGKDSLDCVSTVKNLCAKAEAQLNGNQWNDQTAIVVSTNAEKSPTQLYVKTFGVPANNTHGELVLEKFGENVSDRVGHAATSMHVQCQGDGVGTLGNKSKWPGIYRYFNNCDLNEGAHGKYVYAMFGKENTTLQDLQKIVREDDHSEELNKYIADVLVLVSDKYHGDFHEFTYNGATYKYAQGIYDDPVMWDLNMGAGGPYLHLFYSTDAVKFQRVLDIDESLIAYTFEYYRFGYENFDLSEVGIGPWDVSKFVEAVKYNNGKVEFQSEVADFNQGAGGSFIHMRADYISFNHLKKLQFDEKGYPVK